MQQEFESTLLENCVNEISRLPGIGRKTALRLALHLLRQNEGVATSLGNAIIDMRRGITYCRECHNISESELCPVCANNRRDHSTICVVETVKDVMILENTGQYNGVYHVLGGVVSPLDGISPDMLEIDSLIARVAKGDINEVILALGATMEGDTTGYYLYRKLAPYPEVLVSQLARGVALGNEIEYTDELTLGRSLLNRTPFADSIKS